ncbi:hypothetical protein G6F68_013701 [Rhizopus microsporus]|nr:hypothetical protein G6F68_013701 [Rhizopus microsporus]
MPQLGAGHFLGRFHSAGGHIDGADHHLLAAHQFDQVDRYVRVVAFQRDDVQAGRLQLRERFLVLAPLRAQRLLPVGVGLDAVAVADVHGGFALQSFNRPFQRGHAPVVHFVEEHIEGRLVELDDVDAGRLQLPGFLVEELRELPRQLLAALVVRVVQGVDHGHRAGQGPLDRLRGLPPEELRILHEHRLRAADRADHGAR